MSKTRDTGYLANVIQVHDTGVRIMSGSTMLMAVSSSGAVTITGEISGSDAANARLLSGTGSVGFTTTSSFLAVSSSQQQVSASYISLSGSYTTFSGSASTRVTQIETVYATTGSNSFRANQSITGSLVVSSTITAQTLVVQTVTSSIVYSSGSNIFGCDLNSRQTFTGSVFITGSGIIANVGSACFSGTATIGSDILLSAANPVIYGGTAVGGVSVSNNTGGSYIKIFGACHATTPNVTSFVNANSTVLTINASGNVGVGTATPCSVLHVYGSNPSLIVQNSAVAAVGNTANIFFRNLLSTGCIHFAGYIQSIQQSTTANTGDLSFNTYNNGSVVEGIRITSAGNVGIGACTPNSTLQVKGDGGSGVSSVLRIRDTNSTARTTRLQFEDYAGAYADGLIDFKIPTAGSAVGARLDIGVDSAIMSLVRGGNVGIGCTTPNKTLSVNGCIGMSTTYNWGITNDNDANWGFRVCSTGVNYSTFLSYVGDAGSDRRGGIYNANGHWVAYGNCLGHFVVTCNLSVGVNITAGNTITAGGKITASSAQINGSSLTQTQQLINSTGNFANMVHKVFGAAGGFSTSVICVNLQGAGGYGYIINSGGTGGGVFQSGGGYINGPGNYSHNVAVGTGFTVSCHTCAGTDNVIRFVGAGGTHPFVSIQMFGSLNQSIDDNSIYIAYS